jgi:hypothetical protein
MSGVCGYERISNLMPVFALVRSKIVEDASRMCGRSHGVEGHRGAASIINYTQNSSNHHLRLPGPKPAVHENPSITSSRQSEFSFLTSRRQ